ncbi:MAG: FAD-dependent oxidoreductase, partial [Deltaproteobacteria bacterium]|nr:FAD-dependent oxidoreductase [Deltaproteobacteria bacterium]
YPILAALYHPPGGIVRHDAVVWGYAHQADARGVHIHQNTEVTGIMVEDGKVTGLETSKGSIKTGTVLERDGRLVYHDRRYGRCPPSGNHVPIAGLRYRGAQTFSGCNHRFRKPAR